MRSFFGGEEGIVTNRAKLAPFFGHKFGPQVEVYYLTAAWCLVSIVAIYALTRTPFGRMCNAVRENPERSEFIGYSPRMVRFIAFCLSAFFAGVAGGLSAINFEIMNAQQLGAQQSGLVLLMTYIGGIGYFRRSDPRRRDRHLPCRSCSPTSPTCGSFISAFCSSAVVLFAPGGVAGLADAARGWRRARGEAWRLAPSYRDGRAGAGGERQRGAIMLIELAEPSARGGRAAKARKCAFSACDRQLSSTPWIVAIRRSSAAGVGLGRARSGPRSKTPGTTSTCICAARAKA